MKKSKFTIDFIFNLFYEIIIVLTPLVITPYISRVLGPENIGIKSYTYSIVALFYSLGELGVTVYGQKRIAENVNDLENKSKIFFEIFLMKFILTFIMGTIYFIVFCLFKVDKEYYYYFILWLPLLIEGMLSLKWYYQGIGKFRALAIFYSIGKVLFIIAVFLFVKKIDDLNIYILINASFQAIVNVFMLIYALKSVKFVSLKTLDIFSHFKGAIVYFIPALSMTLYSTLDRSMLRIMTDDLTSIGYYEQAQKVVVLFNSLFLALFSLLRTYFINLKEKKANIQIYIEEIYSKFNFIILMVVPIVCGIFSIIEDFVLLFFGDEYAVCSEIILLFLPIVFFQAIGGFYQACFIVVNDKQKIMNFWYLAAILVNVLLNLVLINILGIYGAIISSIISELIVFIGTIYISKNVFIPKKILKCSWKKIVSGVVMLAISLLIKFLFEMPPHLNLLITIIISAITYFVSLFVLKDNFLLSFFKKQKNDIEER